MQLSSLSKIAATQSLSMLRTYPVVFLMTSIFVQQVKRWLLNLFLSHLKKLPLHLFNIPCFSSSADEGHWKKFSGLQQDYGTTNEHRSMNALQDIRVQHKNPLNSPFTHCELNSVIVFVYETSTYPCRANTCMFNSTLKPLIASASSL